jgi:PII-like signaling protein
VIADALKLSAFFGESITYGARLASDVLMERLAAREIRFAALLRGVEGFGIHRRIHAQRFPDVSTDLPLLAWAVDTHERIEGVLDDVDRAVPRGLVTLETARLATGADVARAQFPSGAGQAAKLTVYCTSHEREVVELMRRRGATGAIVLAGVDGVADGARRRVRLFHVRGAIPRIIASVGPPERLAGVLPHLAEVLPDPIVTLEALAEVKHDGDVREPFVAGDDAELWQTIEVYTRQRREVHELARRLWRAGAAGVTTVLGDWGFSSDERPHGDKLGRLTGHRPSYTVYIDRPAKVAEMWPVIDELTSEHGIVTSLLVPGYRERTYGVSHGTLDVHRPLPSLRRLSE